MESDDEIRRVPEMCGEQNGASASGRYSNSGAETDGANQASGESQKKRGRSPADKGSKRLKRLLRNRVSAQQARERKKAYLVELEARLKDLEKNNSEMEERLSTLQNENQMLRQVGAMKLFKNQAAARFQVALDSARGLDYPFDAVHKLALLARTCTSEESTKRLSMRSMVVALVMLSSATQEWSIDLSFWKS